LKTKYSLLALLCASTSASANLTLDSVTIGDPGNASDTVTATDGSGLFFGSVGYTYAIGTYEVTLSQYTAFLNAVAKTDTHNLYNLEMGADLNSKGITRSGSSGNFNYTAAGDANRPVTYVSWFDAARFVNWLENGQPAGPQAAGTTETGAYTLNGANSGLAFVKDIGAHYWIPSENEWYKAAYYQPVGGDADGYWLYPTRTNFVPNSRNGSATEPDSGNFYRNDGIANGFNGGYAVTNATSSSSTQNYLINTGAYTLSQSYYGTFDQGGNVYEWNDAVIGASRGLRGGGWNSGASILLSSARDMYLPTSESSYVGFRIATDAVPEPGAVVSLLAAGGLLVARRRRSMTSKPTGERRVIDANAGGGCSCAHRTQAQWKE